MSSPEADAGTTRRSLLLAAAALASGRAGASTDEATLQTLNEQYIAASVADDKKWFERMLLDEVASAQLTRNAPPPGRG